MIISFIGHSFVPDASAVKEKVKKLLNSIVDIEKITFYLGGHGSFDEICACVCRELKKEHKNWEIVYVTPYMSLSEQSKIKENERLCLYDSSIYPPIESTPKKFAILKRNEWMMTNSDLIIAYVNHGCGGAYKTLQFAKRKKKTIINICDLI